MQIASKIVPCLWFDSQGEDAARFYTELFPNSRITHIARYPEAGKEVHGRKPGSAMTVSFELSGQAFTALNGGPHFKFNEAVSLQIMCDSQQEVDHYWEALKAGGPVEAQQCGWVKDRYGLSWQVIPKDFLKLMESTDTTAVERAFGAMMGMKKLDMVQLQRAFDGK
ncbi:MAG: VOC family protein [Ramlibacter sp.]|nr:VOC family protein [Ramlibacter sp.]